MLREAQLRGIADILASRQDGPLSEIVCDEGPGLRDRLKDSFFHCNVDFGLLVPACRDARMVLRKPAAVRERSQDWIALRITLEHLVYYTARLQLFLVAAVADEYTMIVTSDLGGRRRVRLPVIRRSPVLGPNPQGMVTRWRRLLAREVRKGNRAEEFRLLADAAVFLAAANLRCTEMLVRILRGTA